MTAFNQYLKTLREEKLLDIGTVAKRIGVHRNTQANYEDRRDPPFDYLVDFANMVGVPLIEILIKRLEFSSASENSVAKAKDSLKSTANKGVETAQAHYNSNEIKIVKLNEDSHSHILINASVYIDCRSRDIETGNMYAFLNPMSGNYFAARLIVTDDKLKLVFDNPNRKDLEFSIDGGKIELTYILKTLGLLGRITKAEVNF